MKDIRYEILDGRVALISFNRPEALNAMNPQMEAEYYHLLAVADNDPAVRVIVVTGTGKGFCSGADISVTVDNLVKDGAPLPVRAESRYAPLLGTPVIAAVNGACAGLGVAVALQADVRFVCATAKLTTAFTRRGLIAEHGTAWLLPRLVGRGRAMDLLLSARMFTGTDAGRWGLAEFVEDTPEEVLTTALQYADDLAKNASPRAMAAVKQQVNNDSEPPFDALLSADYYTQESFNWPDLREGITAWNEKREPQFAPYPPKS